MATYHLNAPLSEKDVRQLKVGDSVYISGPVFTCRSRLHRYVFDEKHDFPAGVADRNVLIHVGPIVLNENGQWRLVSFMPTSSIRFEKWGASAVRDWKLRMIVGKTTMGEGTREAMMEYGCVHVSPQCVSPNLWVDSIRIEGVELFEELGTIEATWHMELNELGPFVVDLDTKGNNLYTSHEKEVNENRQRALLEMGIDPDFEYTKLY